MQIKPRERFVHCIVKITRFYDYDTLFFFRNPRGAQRFVGLKLFSLFACWLTGQANSNHIVDGLTKWLIDGLVQWRDKLIPRAYHFKFLPWQFSVAVTVELYERLPQVGRTLCDVVLQGENRFKKRQEASFLFAFPSKVVPIQRALFQLITIELSIKCANKYSAGPSGGPSGGPSAGPSWSGCECYEIFFAL